MLYTNCGHYAPYGQGCPCVTCPDDTYSMCTRNCLEQDLPKGCAVDTEKLCPRARVYCENGRGETDDV